MIDPQLSFFGVIVAHAMPWLVGSALVLALLKPGARWNGFVIAGQGYLLGVLTITVLIRVLSLLEIPMNFWLLVTVQLLLTAGLLAWAFKRPPGTQTVLAAPAMAPWQIGAVVLLLLLIFARYYLIASELLLRPLYPWDAWMNWAPKAVTWFHYGGELVPFVSPREWLEAGGEPMVYTLGAGIGWKNPEVLPLLQLWAMMGLGTSDHTLIYVPWLFVAVAMGLALYGHLRLAGVGIPGALLACYALLNLPFVNVHVALAGYADIWVTAAFGCAVFALREWGDRRDWGYAAVVGLQALLCAQLKIPGFVLAAILVGLLGVSILQPRRKIIVWTMGAAGLTALYALLVGIDLPLGSLGRLTVDAQGIGLTYLGRYNLSYHPIHKAMASTLFTMWNWNMLCYVSVAAGSLLFLRRRQSLLPGLDLAALYLVLAFVFFVYYFSDRYKFALDLTQVNRALIYAVPLIVYSLAIRVYREFFADNSI